MSTKQSIEAAEAINAWALADGWAIFNAEVAPEIQRDDETARFATDEAALGFVKNKARRGSKRHKEALALIAQR